MSINNQLRGLIAGYVIDRDTLQEIRVPRRASRNQMIAIAEHHGLRVSVVGGEVRLSDDCYTYAVRHGEVTPIAG